MKILKAIDPARWLRFIPLVSGLALLLFGVIFLSPAFRAEKEIWSSGPLSTKHRFLQNDCQACHDIGFQNVPDSKCLMCHDLNPHATSLEMNSHFEAACVSCHAEHKGRNGTDLRGDQSCMSCHSSSEKMNELKLGKEPVQVFSSFKKHPDFLVSNDSALLRFNHQKHQGQVLNLQAEQVNLQCLACHGFEVDSETFVRLEFENHCADCHSLEFDQAFKGIEVPHQDSNQVFSFLLNHYQSNRVSPKQSVRRRPGDSSTTAQLSSKELARQAEKFLFEDGACSFCHQVERLDSFSELNSAFRVVKPKINEERVESEIFSHRTHAAFDCSACHSKALTSEVSEDFLIPSISECGPCHSGDSNESLTQNSCVSCHSYHQSLPLSGEKRESLEDFYDAY